MKRRDRVVLGSFDLLEGRVVLSHLVPLASKARAAFAEHARPKSRAASSAASEVEQVFQSFQQDYDQARSTYFTSIQNQSNPSPATTYAFTAYTTQRVSLLARQTLRILRPISHHPHGPHGVRRLVTRTIMGPREQMPPGSLGNALLASMPRAGVTAPSSSLYTLAQDNAIASAEVGILNGLQRR